VLKRLTLYSCSRRVPVQRFTANTPVCAPDPWSAGADNRKATVGWEHNAPEAVSETRRWSTTDPLADYAGWTEVVIPRGQYVLIDLPVGPTMADVTSIGQAHVTYICGRQFSTGGDNAIGPDVASQWSDNMIAAIHLDDHACGRRSLPEVDRISCPNNYEVTL
jgi:hypothetical protein